MKAVTSLVVRVLSLLCLWVVSKACMGYHLRLSLGYVFRVCLVSVFRLSEGCLFNVSWYSIACFLAFFWMIKVNQALLKPLNILKNTEEHWWILQNIKEYRWMIMDNSKWLFKTQPFKWACRWACFSFLGCSPMTWWTMTRSEEAVSLWSSGFTQTGEYFSRSTCSAGEITFKVN